MNIPNDYKTGNPGMDEKIAKALFKTNQINKAFPINVVESTNKYRVADKQDRTYRDGTLFASKTEMQRYDYLLKIEMAGEITDLQKQVDFMLQESFENPQYGKVGHLVYVADFVYKNISFRKGLEGQMIVEDSKSGIRTDLYEAKRKLFLKRYPNYLFFEV